MDRKEYLQKMQSYREELQAESKKNRETLDNLANMRHYTTGISMPLAKSKATMPVVTSFRWKHKEKMPYATTSTTISPIPMTNTTSHCMKKSRICPWQPKKWSMK